VDLKGKASAGVKWTSVAALVSAMSQLLLVIVLARFLDKSDFGVMALALFVINFSQLFIDMGVSNAIIHHGEVNKNQLSSLYWLNVFTGVLIFLSLLLLSPCIATFYEEPKLQSVINLVALTFLIQPFGMQFSVLLQKNLQFKSIAIRDILSKIIGFFVGAIFAYLEYGVYSLVFSTIASALINTIAVLIIGLPFYKPSFHFRYSDVKPFLSFGFFQMGEKMANFFNSQVDSVIIGKFLGVGSLGVYNVAKNLVMRPTQIINPVVTKVAFPVMSRVKDDISKLRKIYIKVIGFLSYINFPIFLFLAFFSEHIVTTLFGNQWLEAIPVLRVLALYFLIRSTGNPLGALQLARGRADWGFYWNIILLIFIPLSIFIGSRWGIIGVCYAFLLVQILLFIPAWYYMVRPLCEVSFYHYLNAFCRPFITSLIPVLILKFGQKYLEAFVEHNLGLLFLELLIYSLLFLIINFMVNRNVFEEFKRFLIPRSNQI
jgi:O-antigen/teichoic acid export membrane protein